MGGRIRNHYQLPMTSFAGKDVFLVQLIWTLWYLLNKYNSSKHFQRKPLGSFKKDFTDKKSEFGPSLPPLSLIITNLLRLHPSPC